MEETIICKNIKKFFGSGTTLFEALRGINLSVHENELLMLVGPSGAGKTTLLSVIAGILTHNEGDCIVLNKDINHMPERQKTQFRGLHIGFVFQSFNLIPSLTTVENITIPLLLNNWDKVKAMNEATEMLKRLGLEEKIHNYPSQLSGGEQQRVSIARGCIHKPRIILCDEPTSFLDHENGIKVMEMIKEIQSQENCTVVVVTHDPRIFDFADRIVEIDDGIIKNEKKNGK